MDNRRPTSENAPRPLNRTNNYPREGGKPIGTRPYQPRDNRFPPRNDRFQNRDERQQNGDNRFQQGGDNNRSQQGGDNRFQPNRDDRQRSGESRFPSRDTRSQPPREGRFQPRNDKFQPRGTGRFEPRGTMVKPWEKPPARIVSEMQVTDGKHRGKYLKSTTSEKVRPTARRIREVMFRIIFRRVRAGRFLDLCAGSGTVGIEAISRGAIVSTFVERSAQMCSFIKKNMETCGIKEGHGEVHQIEVVPFLKKMAKRKRCWDVVYFDPPYDSNYDEVLAFFSRGVAIKPGGLLIIEHPNEMFFPEKFGVMARWRVVVQGETSISFYEKKRING